MVAASVSDCGCTCTDNRWFVKTFTAMRTCTLSAAPAQFAPPMYLCKMWNSNFAQHMYRHLKWCAIQQKRGTEKVVRTGIGNGINLVDRALTSSFGHALEAVAVHAACGCHPSHALVAVVVVDGPGECFSVGCGHSCVNVLFEVSHLDDQVRAICTCDCVDLHTLHKRLVPL